MSAPTELDIEAEAVRRSIAQDARAGSVALAEFSQRHARTLEQKNAALAMKAGMPRVDDQAILTGLQHRMLDILNGIIAERANPEANRVYDEAKIRLFGRFRREASKHETICRTDTLEKRFARSDFTMGPISLELRSGEITALIGENAHGKTTLMRTLIGELRPSRGSVAFPTLAAGSSFRWASVRQHIGYLPQKLPNWYRSLADTLHFQAAIRGLSPAESETQVQYLAARLDLAQHLDKRWFELSGGFQLRFALAQALAGRPRLLVLDEPLANLDPKAQASLLWDIRHLAKSVQSPMAVLISSQVLDPMQAISDNVIFLRNGRVAFQGPTGAIGANRTSNLYECDTQLPASVLQQRIGARVLDIRHNGVYYLIRTTLAISYPDMLELLKESDVEFTHCRDIGRKAMGLFEQQ